MRWDEFLDLVSSCPLLTTAPPATWVVSNYLIRSLLSVFPPHDSLSLSADVMNSRNSRIFFTRSSPSRWSDRLWPEVQTMQLKKSIGVTRPLSSWLIFVLFETTSSTFSPPFLKVLCQAKKNIAPTANEQSPANFQDGLTDMYTNQNPSLNMLLALLPRYL